MSTLRVRGYATEDAAKTGAASYKTKFDTFIVGPIETVKIAPLDKPISTTTDFGPWLLIVTSAPLMTVELPAVEA